MVSEVSPPLNQIYLIEHSQARMTKAKSQGFPGVSMSTCALRVSENWPVILSLPPYSLKPAHCSQFTAQLCQPAHYKEIKGLTALRRSAPCAPFFPAIEVPKAPFPKLQPAFYESDQAVVFCLRRFSVLRCHPRRACGRDQCSVPASIARRQSRGPPSGSPHRLLHRHRRLGRFRGWGGLERLVDGIASAGSSATGSRLWAT